MKTFIEKQHSYTQPAGPQKSYPAKHSCNPYSNKAEFKVTNAELSKLARANEKAADNNNVYNGKNISDNRKVTNFYALKAQTVY